VCVSNCDLETSTVRRLRPELGCSAKGKISDIRHMYIYQSARDAIFAGNCRVTASDVAASLRFPSGPSVNEECAIRLSVAFP
jgi:hypothetical protein